MVINLDESKNKGTHWISLSIKNKTSYYFDSYGFPPTKKVEIFVQNLDIIIHFRSKKVMKLFVGIIVFTFCTS